MSDDMPGDDSRSSEIRVYSNYCHSHCHAKRATVLSVTYFVIGCLSTIISHNGVRFYQIAPVASPGQHQNLVVSHGLIASNWFVFHSTEARLLLRSVMQWDPLKRPTIPAISMEPWMTGRKLHPGERLYREQVKLIKHITLFAIAIMVFLNTMIGHFKCPWSLWYACLPMRNRARFATSGST